MTANAVNRETVRDEFARLLEVALVGVGLPVSEVINYPRSVIDKSPTIVVASSGTSRMLAGIGTQRWFNFFILEVFTFVRDAAEDESWTEANVEDQLDYLDKLIADVVANNLSNSYWQNVSYSADPENASIPPASEIITDVERGLKIEMRKLYFEKLDGS